MKNLTPAQKRDIALNYLARFNDREVSLYELNRYLKFTHPADFTLNETENILKSMVTEGLSRKGHPDFYRVTLKGTLMRDNGGYDAQIQQNNARVAHMQLATNVDSQDVSLYPWMLAVGGILLITATLVCGFMFWHWNIPF